MYGSERFTTYHEIFSKMYKLSWILKTHLLYMCFCESPDAPSEVRNFCFRKAWNLLCMAQKNLQLIINFSGNV